MKLLKKNWRILSGFIGIILVGIALLGAYWWFYKLVPVRNLASLTWRESHSQKAIWSEEQKKYFRTKASPDLCFGGDRIGHYGDKQWFLWLHDQIEKDKDFRVCGCTEYVFALIANQTLESRQSWLVTNRNRTQEEWIKDGFAKYNVFPSAPAEPSDFEPLLQLLAKPQWSFFSAGHRARMLRRQFRVMSNTTRFAGFAIPDSIQRHLLCPIKAQSLQAT